jgi:hypothetical protein
MADADNEAERTVARLSVDQSPEGQRLWEQRLKCMRAYARGIDTFRKYQDKMKSGRPAPRIDDLRPIPDYRKRRLDVPGPIVAQAFTASADASAGAFAAEDRQPESFEQSLISVASPEPPVESNPENPTTEAKSPENAVTIQNGAPIAVASNSALDSPLDKRDDPSCGAQDRSSAPIQRHRLEPTSQCRCSF